MPHFKKIIQSRIPAIIYCAAILMGLSTVASAGGRLIVFGIDESGSYEYRAKSIAKGADIIKSMSPGDVLYVRRITDNSYDDNCIVFKLTLPEIGLKPSNKFDSKAMFIWKLKNKKIILLKSQAVKILKKLPSANSKKTDIWGFLAAAADRIVLEKPADSLIVIASDMVDNCRKKVSLDFNSAEIIIAGFQSGGDPKAARKLISGWEKELTVCNASAVQFLPMDARLELMPPAGNN